MNATARATDVLQKINILEGHFSTSEALDVVNQLINVKINHHKLQILSSRIHDETASTEFHEGRIRELEVEKNNLRYYVNRARSEGKLVQMNGKIEIALV